jgi:hypothetical protein
MFQTEKEQAEFMQAEYDLFAPTFKDNKPILKVLRKAILGIELSPTEKELFKLVPSTIIDKMETYLLPKVTGNEELHMVNDFWFQFNLKERSQYQVEMDILYLPIVLNFFENAVKRLRGEKINQTIADVQYSYTADKDTNITSVIARNVILATAEGMLATIYHKANNAPLTEEQIKNRNKANSSI